MAGRNFHKNRTKERKQRQADARDLAMLRKKALAYEGVTERNVQSKSAQQLRRIVALGKYRPHLFGPNLSTLEAAMTARGLRR